jgi:heme a synthase
LDNSIRNYHKLAIIALILSVFVIMLGAYTRLTDAGLGCPDWPGCYGRMVLPNTQPGLGAAQQAYPEQPLVAHKAWTEMTHRYVAGTLGILIIILAVWAVRNRQKGLPQPIVTPFLLVGVLIFQAVLGMWTVTLKLLPLVVTGHLLGGMAIAALLSWLCCATHPWSSRATLVCKNSLRVMGQVFVGVGLIILILQIFLGAWTSTNYAALACGTDFPSCLSMKWGEKGDWMQWLNAFNLLSPVGPNYEGGRLEMQTRMTIQMAHRYGALVTFVYFTAMVATMCKVRGSRFFTPKQQAILYPKTFLPVQWFGWTIVVLLCVQIVLGILNVVKLLPLGIAVAHNGVAVLLLITVVALLQRFQKHAVSNPVA